MGVDREDVKLHIDNIVRSLNSIQHITGNLTKMENLCANTKEQMEDLRRTISSELDQMLVKSTEKDPGKEKEKGKDEEKETHSEVVGDGHERKTRRRSKV